MMSIVNILKRSLWPRIDTALSKFGGYAYTILDEDYYYCTVKEEHIKDLHNCLDRNGFSISIISSLKKRDCPGPAKIQRLSYVWRASIFSHYQIHIDLFETNDSGNICLYTHHEYNWVRHPIKHYKREGVSDENAEKICDYFLSTCEIDTKWVEREDRCHI
jgi:hypothetical protein